MIFLGPLDFPASKTVVQHDELPPVTNELSITLRLNIKSHDPGWMNIFQKGARKMIRTPALWLSPNISRPYPAFSTNINENCGINEFGKGFVLNKWYHICYALSKTHKRMDFYVDGKLVGSKIIEQIQKEYIVFNDDPLRIGHSFDTEFNGKMSDFCYHNWRLSDDEIVKNFVATYETYQ
ncbi:hypothetical protein Glove_117g388 [Diversispora epigaea]|uniref:Concanavalin A-like lectin/glucanase domain-containing protein n=1 Tax=Diversispora epigaea TaxID=1348612 RepID=A0A397J0B0_9GLOM|nr:hypothetical protein Glove_117g388 [Diversispora epigaea]